MLAIERRNAILSKLSLNGKVVVSELSQEFNVTEETIRRDLEKLDNDGLARKTYGGAVKVENYNIDLPFHVRQQTNVESKRKIATVIGEMIHDGDYIMLDSSTTALYVVQNILDRKKITIITNSIKILIELCNKPDWTIISTGGILKDGSLSLLGYQAERMVSSHHVDLAVCSCKGLNENLKVTDSNDRDAEIKKAFFNSANHKVLAIDSSKFDKTSFIEICDVQNVDTIVTDQNPGDKWCESIENSGTRLLYYKNN